MEDKYIAMRVAGVINPAVLFEYAVSKGFKFGYNEFLHCLRFSDINFIIESLDKEFGLTRVYDKNNNLIKVFK